MHTPLARICMFNSFTAIASSSNVCRLQKLRHGPAGRVCDAPVTNVTTGMISFKSG
jgi:hypothetical protein